MLEQTRVTMPVSLSRNVMLEETRHVKYPCHSCSEQKCDVRANKTCIVTIATVAVSRSVMLEQTRHV